MPQQDFTQRAIAAYFRTGTKEGWRCDQPSAADSGTVELNNRHYVVLANSRGILAVYRIKPDGLLRRLKRWPHAQYWRACPCHPIPVCRPTCE